MYTVFDGWSFNKRDSKFAWIDFVLHFGFRTGDTYDYHHMAKNIYSNFKGKRMDYEIAVSPHDIAVRIDAEKSVKKTVGKMGFEQ